MEQPTSTDGANLVAGQTKPMGYELVSPMKTNKMAGAGQLAELAESVKKADAYTKANAGNKLTVIADQIRMLQEKARQTLEDAKRDAALHHAACNLVKKPGSFYYLYERDDGDTYLSILSPEEWGPAMPNDFLGAFRLEYDQSWTPMDGIDRRDEQNSFIDKVYHAQLALTAGSATADVLGKV